MNNLKDFSQMTVSAIKEGTVIDHIPPHNLFKVISILGLSKISNQITFGTNLESKRMHTKAIIKITDKFFCDDEINKIAMVAPLARLNTIRNYKVVEKREVQVPDTVMGIVRCLNPKCITNNEKVTTKFDVLSKTDITLRCHYCEQVLEADEVSIL
jgi:aspartate carbamoyltransferase regulatory subunit